jgi:glutamate-1-semialdehyde 2,1-aminomutase
MRDRNVIGDLREKGALLADGLRRLIGRHGLNDVIAVNGVPSWTLLSFCDAPNGTSKEAVKTLLMIEMLRRGVLSAGSHNISYAHNAADIKHVLDAYDHALAGIAKAIAEGDVEARLGCAVIRPVFAVRG